MKGNQMEKLTAEQAGILAQRLRDLPGANREEFFKQTPRVVYGPRGITVLLMIICAVASALIVWFIIKDSPQYTLWAALLGSPTFFLSLYGIRVELKNVRLLFNAEGIHFHKGPHILWKDIEAVVLRIETPANVATASGNIPVACRVSLLSGGKEWDFPAEQSEAVGLLFAILPPEKRKIVAPPELLLVQQEEDKNKPKQ
jgi:hypothetical protein